MKSFARSDKNYDSKYDYNRSIGRGTGYLHPTYYSQYGIWEVNGVDDEGDLRRSTKERKLDDDGFCQGSIILLPNIMVSIFRSLGVRIQSGDWFGWPHYKIYLMDQNAEAKESSTQFNGASSSSTTSGIADWYCYRLAEAYLRAEAKFYNGDPVGCCSGCKQSEGESSECKTALHQL